jgi:hypothetical protein
LRRSSSEYGSAEIERFEKVLAPMEEVFVRVVGEEEAA